jgi:hypothetical protein
MQVYNFLCGFKPMDSLRNRRSRQYFEQMMTQPFPKKKLQNLCICNFTQKKVVTL